MTTTTRALVAQPHESGIGASTLTRWLERCPAHALDGCSLACVYSVEARSPEDWPSDSIVRALERALWIGELAVVDARLHRGDGRIGAERMIRLVTNS